MINTIFASHLIDSKGRLAADEPVRQTTEIQTVSHGASGQFLVPALLAAHVACLPQSLSRAVSSSVSILLTPPGLATR